MYKHFSKVMLACSLFMTNGASLAQQETVSRSPSGDRATLETFKIDDLQLNEGRIVLGDRLMQLTSATRVYRANGTLGSTTDLRRGMRVQIRTHIPSTTGSRPVLTDIRIVQ